MSNHMAYTLGKEMVADIISKVADSLHFMGLPAL